MSRDVIIEQDGLAGLALLVLHWLLFTAVRWPGMVALVVLLLLAVAIGHLLGGPHPDDRTALAIACATRHIGVAVVVATAVRAPWCSWRPTSWPRRWCRSRTSNGVAVRHV
jgi:predicted cobalt transporter CbtA